MLSNLASRQNLFRVFDGLTRLTGDSKYRQAAVDAHRRRFVSENIIFIHPDSEVQ